MHWLIKNLFIGLRKFFTLLGYTIYTDWINDKEPDKSYVSKQTDDR